MGKRGPVKGKGGRPTKRAASKKKATATKPTRKKAATPELLSKAEADSQFASDLSAMTFPVMIRHAGQWQPLSDQDQTLVALLWEAVQRYRELSAYVHKLGPGNWTFTTDKGYEAQIPELGLLNKSIDQIAKLTARFGMSPADRVRLGSKPDDTNADSAFAEYMKGNLQLSAEVEKKAA